MIKKKQEPLSCAAAQAKIMDYINDNLTLQETEQFLRHTLHCGECREELDVYYTIMTGMKKLDADENINMDFKAELKRKIRKSEEKILRYKRGRVTRRLLFLALIIGGFCLDAIVDTREEPERSDFTLKYDFFRERPSVTAEYVRSHYSELQRELSAWREQEEE